MTSLYADVALLILTAGVVLIYTEFNRPGLILPGAIGLTLSLLSAATLFRRGCLPAENLVACLVGFALLVLSTRMRKHLILGVFATIALFFGFHGTACCRLHLLVTISCALFLGAGTSFLTTIAARARQNKGLDLK